MQKEKILIVEDEIKILEVITSLMEGQGYEVYQAESGKQALDIFKDKEISLIILDLMLPDISGEEVCMRMREKSRVPIIMLTAKSNEENLLHGLDIGADDYITKPFSLMELVARIKVILRRSSDELKPLYKYNSFQNGDLYINVESNIIKKKNELLSLTQSEWKILLALMKYPNKVFTREELVYVALGSDFEGYNRIIDTHIKNLRQKIEDNPKAPRYVITVFGKGYKFGGE
ncbi:response regulator transcription factor [Terrisporobacter vanillatitrophus]|uniref:response regulator transcription factor n=1 Tax=Terrisporobacter vanillatitrophus TaxID=3058402 RepID=UPI00336624C8